MSGAGTQAGGLDWAGLMRVGLSGLRLPPEVFWDLSPVELLIMLGESAREAPMGRSRLEALAAAFPDGSGRASGPGDDGSGRAE